VATVAVIFSFLYQSLTTPFPYLQLPLQKNPFPLKDIHIPLLNMLLHLEQFCDLFLKQQDILYSIIFHLFILSSKVFAKSFESNTTSTSKSLSLVAVPFA